ncbi:MAG: hypothetical protein AAF752_10050 [Bacteroidota bacterium]
MPLSQADSLAVSRIHWAYSLQKEVAKAKWPAFSLDPARTTLVYKTRSASYVFAPNAAARRLPHVQLALPTSELIRTDSLIRGAGYIMSVSVATGDVFADRIEYESPVLFSSDVETTHATIPDVSTTEMWATMLVHEMFHVYQRLLGYAGEGNQARKRLKAYHAETLGFAERVRVENDMLLRLLAQPHPSRSQIEAYVDARTARMRSMPEDLQRAEFALEKIEGSGRYAEANAMLAVASLPADSTLSRLDSLYTGGSSFADFDLS